jgi:hypothetical protein
MQIVIVIDDGIPKHFLKNHEMKYKIFDKEIQI